MVTGVYCYYSGPAIDGTIGYVHEGGSKFSLNQIELVHMCLSALIYDGPTILYTDPKVFTYLYERDLIRCFDEIDCTYYKQYEELKIVNSINWIGFRWFMASVLKPPFLMIEADIILHTPLNDYLLNAPFRFSHLETDERDVVYLSKPELKNYNYSPQWKFGKTVSNLSLMYFNDPSFHKYLTTKAVEFYQANNDTKHPRANVRSIFDQQLAYMCLEEMNLPILSFSNQSYDQVTKKFTTVNDDKNLDYVFFDHLWFDKWAYKYDANLRAVKKQYYERLATKYFPSNKPLLNAISKIN